MAKPFTTVMFFLFLVFAGWIAVSSNWVERIGRACEPVNWGGRMVGSLAAIVYPRGENSVASGTRSAYKNCQFVVIRQFYQQEYLELQASVKAGMEREAAEAAAAAKKTQPGAADPALNNTAGAEKSVAQEGSPKKEGGGV